MDREVKPHPATLSEERLLAECDVRFMRRSGPGGQNRNKVETAAILSHRPTGLSAEANETRSQAGNRAKALFRLRVLLALKVRTAGEDRIAPSPLWSTRVRGGRIAINPENEAFPALLAEILDVLDASEFDPKKAGDRMGVSPSQIVKFLKYEPRALALVNERRGERGLHLLK